MTTPSRPFRRYRIILQGDCSQLLAGVLSGHQVEVCRGWTCVMACVRDESELYGLLDRFQEFALHIASLNELSADAPRPQTTAGTAEIPARPGTAAGQA